MNSDLARVRTDHAAGLVPSAFGIRISYGSSRYRIVQGDIALDEELMEKDETVKRRWRNYRNHRGLAGGEEVYDWAFARRFCVR